MLIKTLVLFYRWLYFLFCRKKLRLMRFETAETGTLRAEKITLDVYILDQLREYTRLARTQPQNIMGEKKARLSETSGSSPPLWFLVNSLY